jgi:hypothetical protein
MKTLTQIEKTPVGLSGSLHYKDSDVQTVHELIGIPYQAVGEFALTDAISLSKSGIVAVKFDNGATCFGYVNFDFSIPSFKTLRMISKMPAVTRVAYFGKDGSQEWAGSM